MDGGDHNKFAQRLFSPLPQRYDRLAEVLSMGQNQRWRTAMVDRVVRAEPPLVLDVASGTAGVAVQAAKRSGTHVVGIDLTSDMLEQGLRNIADAGLRERVDLVNGQAECLPFPDAIFDGLMFTYLLRYVDAPQAALDEMARVVKPGGVVASLDFLAPTSPFWRFWWWLYTRLVLPAAGLLTGGRAWYRVGRFLGPNISLHYRRYPVEWIVDAWERAGIEDVQTKVMSLGGGLVMWGTKAQAHG